MKVRVHRAELSEALSLASSVIPARTPKEVLKSVLLTAKGDKMVVTATDLDLGIHCPVHQVEVVKAGQTLVGAEKLVQIAKTSSDDVVVLETDDSVCHIRGSDSHFQVYQRDPADFPTVATFDSEPDFSVSAAVVRRLAEWTIYAAARENTRYAINGVLCERKKQKLVFVATDGRRLAKAVGETLSGSGESRVIIPSRGLKVFMSALHDGDEQVDIRVTGNQVAMRGIRASVNMALVEGQFPSYEDVIPTEHDKSARLSTQALLSAVTRASLLTDEESKGIRLSFEKEKLTLSSRAPGHGEATIEMAAEFTGEPISIAFNPVFMIDVLKVAGTEDVTLDLKESSRPGVIRAGSNFVYVVMPVSL